MKKGSVSFMAVAALMFMQGCGFDEPRFELVDPQDAPHRVEILGEINQQPATRVTTDGFCTGDEVGLYLVNYEGADPGTLKVEGNQADNVKFSYNESGSWVSEYDIYYKDNETKVDFYAYYPYAGPSSIEAYPFEVSRDQSKEAEHGQMATYEASDFLWANAKNVAPTASKVILTFNHKMSSARVRFSQGSGWEDDAEFAAVTKEVLVTNTVRKSTIDLSTGVVTPEGEAPLTGIVPMNDNGEFRAIVVPQTVAAGTTLLTITIDGKPRNYVRDTDTEYLPGKITTYDLSIRKVVETGDYEVELTGVSITAWEADNLSHGEDAREYVVIHNAVPGGLEKTIVDRLEMDPTKIKNMKLTGKITKEDYDFMREKMTGLQRLNLKEVESVMYEKWDGQWGNQCQSVPEGVYAIPKEAFYGKKSLIKCVLSDKLERIEYDAFCSTSLTGALQLPEGLKYVTGFNGTKITSVYFPNGLEEIGHSAFGDCKSLLSEISLPESLRKIGSEAFYNSAIKGNLVLPHRLEVIERGAFWGCSGLSGSLVIPDGITTITERSFSKCGFTGALTLPEGLVEIEHGAFSETGFKGELNIPKSVIAIGNDAFHRGLFSGTLVLPPDLISIGQGAFSYCWRLSGVVEIPENIISIPSGLFTGCSNLEGVILHKDVEVIESGAFKDCFYLTSLTSKAKNPPAINSNSFDGVAKDNFTIEVPEASVNLYKNAENWDEFKRISAHREFSVSRNLYRTLNASHSKEFLVRAPAGESWSVESKPEWVEVTPMEGVGKVDVTVKTHALEQGAGNRSGEVVFLLNDKSYRYTMKVEQYDYEYGDGDVVTFQEATVGKGVNIVLVADCFDAKDISEGKYLDAITEAYGYFFDIEPYLTYQDYFNVYGVFGMSPDSGMGTVNTIREARFGSQYTLNAGISPDFNSTFAAACLAPIKGNVSQTLVIMVENSSDYAGLCYMWGDGSAVAVVPMSEDPAPYDFRGLVHHEAGGHGFAKLADEYIYHNAFIYACEVCGDASEPVVNMKACGFYENISLTGSMHEVPWSHLIYDPQFSNIVDVYEGAYMHTRGVFRSEPNSCMNSNIPYYNAISREVMVKNIMRYAGERYSFEEFKANDKLSLPETAVRSSDVWTPGDGVHASSRFDQRPPRFMGDKPEFDMNDFQIK